MPQEKSKGTKPFVLPQNTSALIEWLDEKYPAPDITDATLGTEVGRIRLARETGERKLIDHLKDAQARTERRGG